MWFSLWRDTGRSIHSLPSRMELSTSPLPSPSLPSKQTDRIGVPFDNKLPVLPHRGFNHSRGVAYFFPFLCFLSRAHREQGEVEEGASKHTAFMHWNCAVQSRSLFV
jgi:hypothetical protein|uniref:Uncharacterized protein n=1 Tax=Bionectria ochroleuca TaxID=29856 RepID=A0A8H7TJF5_BIOOC